MLNSAALGLLGLLVIQGSTAPASSLSEARRQEASTLRQERDALQDAIGEADNSARSAKATLHGEIEELTATLTRLQAENTTRERRLPAKEQARSTQIQNRRLEELTDQMSAWLETRGQHAPAPDGPEALAALVGAVLADVERTSTLRIEPDVSYFAAAGEARTGTVLRIGEVAAVLWDGPATPLVDTPEGLMEVRGLSPERTPAGPGERVRVVLHDPGDPPEPDAYVDPSWRTTMDTGGPLMWVLLGFAFVAIGVALERSLVIAWIALRWRQAVRRLEGLQHLEGDARERRLADERSFVAAPLVTVMSQSADSNAEIVEDRATQAVLMVRERLFSRLSVLGLAAAVAPLTGLLGTVSGMITTFSVVTTKGTSDPQLLAGGISEALLTTQFGLAIAIPALIVHALLSRGARRVVASTEQTVLRHIHGLGGGPLGHAGHRHHHHDHDAPATRGESSGEDDD